MMKQLKLYSYYQSSASWRVRAVLAFKDLPFEYEAINLLTGEQHKMDDINPMRQVPALKLTGHNGTEQLITQSLTIIQFLEENFPDKPSIFPRCPFLKSKSRAIAETISSGIQPLQNLETLVDYKKPLNMDDGETTREERFKIAKYWMTKKFDRLEELVKATAGKYCVGDEPSLADFCLVPQMYNAKRFEIDMSKYTTLVSINERLLELDCIKKSHPLVCPDSPSAK